MTCACRFMRKSAIKPSGDITSALPLPAEGGRQQRMSVLVRGLFFAILTNLMGGLAGRGQPPGSLDHRRFYGTRSYGAQTAA